MKKKILTTTVFITVCLIHVSTHSFFKKIKKKTKINRCNEKDIHGYTPLLRACYANKKEEIRFLVSHCDKKTIDYIRENGQSKGETALYWACRHKNFEAIKMLVEKGAEIRKKDIEATKDNKRIYDYLNSAMRNGVIKHISSLESSEVIIEGRSERNYKKLSKFQKFQYNYLKVFSKKELADPMAEEYAEMNECGSMEKNLLNSVMFSKYCCLLPCLPCCTCYGKEHIIHDLCSYGCCCFAGFFCVPFACFLGCFLSCFV